MAPRRPQRPGGVVGGPPHPPPAVVSAPPNLGRAGCSVPGGGEAGPAA